MIKVTGQLYWSVWVECPNCKKGIDLADEDHKLDYALSRYIFMSKWDLDCIGLEIICKYCNCEFELEKVEY